MAIALPLLLSATGAAAGIGTALGVSAGIVSAVAGVAIGATGIGKSINKAASKVFGEDVVNVANMAGTVALAAGWNPSSMFDGGASASGALSSAGAAQADAVGALDMPASAGSLPFAGGAGQATSGASAAANASVGGGNAITAGASGASGGGALSSIANKFNSLSPQAQAALVNVGGQVLSGAAGGLSQKMAADDAREERMRREERFNTGSGVQAIYKPRKPILTPVGG